MNNINIDQRLKDVAHGVNLVRDKYKAAKIYAASDEGTKLIEIAVAKATSHEEIPPKEKHVRTLKSECGPGSPPQHVHLVLSRLDKRAHNDHGWLITLKCLMTIHRLVRETDVFLDGLLDFSDHTGNRGVLRLDNYKDVTSPESWDLCTWIRVYSIYLDEAVELYRVTKIDYTIGKQEVANKIRALPVDQLLEFLPRLQRAQARIMGCVPEGAAARNSVVLDSTLMLVEESFLLYAALSEGIVCLVDCFFDLDRTKAKKGLEIFKLALDGTESMKTYFESIKKLERISHTVTFPELGKLPVEFLSQMEEYAATAPIDGGSIGEYTSPQKASDKALSAATRANPALAHARASGNSVFGKGMGASAPTVAPAFKAPAAALTEDLLRDLDISDQGQGAAPANNFFGGSAVGGQPDPFAAPVSDPFSSAMAHQGNHPSAHSSGFNGITTNNTSFSGPTTGSFSSQPGPKAAQDPFAPSIFSHSTVQSQPQSDPFAISSNPFGQPGSVQQKAQGSMPAPSLGLGSAQFAQQPPAWPAPQPAIPLMSSGAMPKPQPIGIAQSSNPFVKTGIQPTTNLTSAKMSVHDPFADLTGLGGSAAKGVGQSSAPMRAAMGSQNAPKPSLGSNPSAGPSNDPFGSFL